MDFVTMEGCILGFRIPHKPYEFTTELVGIMAALRRAIELSLEDEDVAKLRSIAQDYAIAAITNCDRPVFTQLRRALAGW